MVSNEVAYFATVLKYIFEYLYCLESLLVTLLHSKILLFTSLRIVEHTVTPYNVLCDTVSDS